MRGGDEEFEYDPPPGEDPEFEGPTEEEYEFERAQYEDEHERD